MSRIIVAFDLDGTLADLTHRLHFIQQQPKDWDAFFAACADDKPIPPLVDLASRLMELPEYSIEIWSGRSDAVRGDTARWLRMQMLDGYSELRMRTAGDHRPDNEVKGGWLDALPADKRPILAFDDRQQVVDMWRSRGVMCCQVAPGNF